MLLNDITAGAGPSDLKDTTPPPRRTRVDYTIRGYSGVGDDYSPGRGQVATAGIVLVPGLTPQGMNDPRVIALANSLARVHFHVFVPDLENLRALRVRPGDAQEIADAVQVLDGRMKKTGRRAPLGIAAISYAVGPAVLAALEPDVRQRVDFILGIGGYYSSVNALTYVTTGWYQAPGETTWRHRKPNAYGRWVFVAANAGLIESARDRVDLRAIAERKLADPSAETSDLTRDLGPAGKSIMALLENDDPSRVPTLIEALPTAVREDIKGLDLSHRDLSRLHASLILVHGRNDTVIPWTESARLAAAVPEGQADLFVPDNLAHVTMKPGGWGDGLVLLSAAYRLLALRSQ